MDVDFAGNWLPKGVQKDSMTSKSCLGWVITYTGCPVTWASKLQTLMALLTTEAKYISLSAVLRDQIPLMELAKELVSWNIDFKFHPLKVH